MCWTGTSIWSKQTKRKSRIVIADYLQVSIMYEHVGLSVIFVPHLSSSASAMMWVEVFRDLQKNKKKLSESYFPKHTVKTDGLIHTGWLIISRYLLVLRLWRHASSWPNKQAFDNVALTSHNVGSVSLLHTAFNPGRQIISTARESWQAGL